MDIKSLLEQVFERVDVCGNTLFLYKNDENKGYLEPFGNGYQVVDGHGAVRGIIEDLGYEVCAYEHGSKVNIISFLYSLLD